MVPGESERASERTMLRCRLAGCVCLRAARAPASRVGFSFFLVPRSLAVFIPSGDQSASLPPLKWEVCRAPRPRAQANTMKIASAGRIVAVIPYFPYSKQSKQKKRGAIPSKLMATLLKVAGAAHAVSGSPLPTDAATAAGSESQRDRAPTDALLPGPRPAQASPRC